MNKKQEIEEHIIALEKNALENWMEGDPSSYLDLYSEDINYFDSFWDKRLEGREEMEEFYKSYAGVIHVDSYEMKNPHVFVTDQMAVLSYRVVYFSGNISRSWNCTEVFKLGEDGDWKIVHSHWSLYRPF